MKEIDYNLYKSVFNNIFLSKRIYKFIKNTNKQITNEIKSYTRIVKYEQANYKWIIKNEKYGLFIDKIKNGIKLDSNYLLSNDFEIRCFYQFFFKSIKQCNNENDSNDKIEKLLLKKLFKINGNPSHSINPISLQSQNSFQLNLLKYSIELSNFNFFKIIIKQLKLKYQPGEIDEKEFIYISYDDQGIARNTNLLKYAFELGNLKIIKYLIDIVGLKFPTNNLDQIIPCCLISCNRDKVIQFLLSDYGEPHSKLISNSGIEQPYTDGFTCKLWLNHSLFKQLYEIGEPIFYGKPFTYRDLACKLYGANENPYIYFERKEFNFLNYLQNSLFILSIVDNKYNLYSNLLLKKVNHLIKYNDIIVGGSDNVEKEYFKSNYQKNKYILENEDIIIIKQFGGARTADVTSNSSNDIYLLSKIKNFFALSLSSTPKTIPLEESIKPSIQHSTSTLNNDIQFTEIVYNEFNFKREIYRTYIFDFILKIFVLETPNFMERSKLIVNYAIKFNEYHLILNEILNGKSIDQHDMSKLFSYLVLCSIKTADSELIKFISKNIATPELDLKNNVSNVIRNRTVTGNKDHLFDLNLIPIEKQVQFVITFIDHGLNFNHILTHIINSINEINIDSILNTLVVNGYKEVDIKHFLRNDNYHSINYDTEYNKFIHCFNNYNQLFNWYDNSIGKLIVETGNLKLMSFLHENKICGFNDQDSNSMINYSIYKNVAQFMIDEFGYKFNSMSLYIFSQLDEWNSNYLFYYSFRELIKQHNQDFNFNIKPFVVVLPKSNIKYKQLYFIKTIVLNEKLIKQGNFKMGYSNSLAEVTTTKCNSFTLFDINFGTVLSSFNLKYINQFINENQEPLLNSNLELSTFNMVNDFLEFERKNNISKNNQKIDCIKDFLLKFKISNSAQPYF